MLTKEERLKLGRLLEVSGHLHPAQTHYEMTTEAFQWLAQKLKEVNNECRLTTAGLNLVVETVRDQLIKGEI